MAALISGDVSGGPHRRGASDRWARWSILAQPDRTEITESLDRAIALLEGDGPGEPARGSGGAAPAFVGGWIASVDFETTFDAEPRALAGLGEAGRRPGRGVSVLQRCPAAYVHDGVTGAWWVVGEPGAIDALPALRPGAGRESRGFRVDALGSTSGPDAFKAGVERVRERIAAGDVYQVNLAHVLEGRFTGSARALFAAALRAATPWYGAYLETDATAIVSASPELFLTVEPGPGGMRRVVTRPMKGTRPAGRAAELEASAKDRAELTMIVDLLRNDLGRVARPGSVRVEDRRGLEPHAAGGLVQAVATIAAELEPERTLGDLLRAVLPPGSVTGAPKIAAARLIAALEPACRGAYCGAIGYVDRLGRAGFSVAIRTVEIAGPLDRGRTLAPARLRYGAGAGIVADSDPHEEWQETLHKAGWLTGLGIDAGGRDRNGVTA